MPKTQLTKEKRNLIHEFMMTRLKENHDSSEYTETLSALANMVNDILRSKYSESDMEVIRKYNLNRVDTCLNFTTDGGRFFGINFCDYIGYDDETAKNTLSDIPYRSGCSSREVFSCTDELAELAERFGRMHTEQQEMFKGKRNNYYAFLAACKTVEDVEAVVALPEDIRTRLGKSPNALLAINPETVEGIRRDFASVEVTA